MPCIGQSQTSSTITAHGCMQTLDRTGFHGYMCKHQNWQGIPDNGLCEEDDLPVVALMLFAAACESFELVSACVDFRECSICAAEGRSAGSSFQQDCSSATRGCGVFGPIKGNSPSVAMLAANSCLQKLGPMLNYLCVSAFSLLNDHSLTQLH